MTGRKKWMALPPISLLVFLSGCGTFGKVNQGRVIGFDRERGLVTFIEDSNYREPGKPRYDVLPPLTIRIPGDRQAMGPAPQAGKLMLLDTQNRKLVFFDAATQTFQTISYTLIEQRDNIFKDDARIAGAKFPIVDRVKKTIAVYLPGQRQLVTFSVPDEYFALPDDTWRAGDEIRYYYKDPGQALRLMNISRTDLT